MSDDNQYNDDGTPKKGILDITIADIHRENTKNEASDVRHNLGQDHINLRSLQSEVDIWEAKAAAYTEQGLNVPKNIETQLNAKRGSLDWQKRAYAANSGRSDGLERRDGLHFDGGREDMMQKQLTDVRRADMTTFTTRLQREHRISNFEALQMAEKMIAVDGYEKYLPQFAKVAAKVAAQTGEDAMPARQQAPAAPKPVQDDSAALKAELRGLVKQNSDDLANGHPPNSENYARVEEIRRKLNV